jgi:hypothetical protein
VRGGGVGERVLATIGYTAGAVSDVHELVRNSDDVMAKLREMLPEVENSFDILKALCETPDLNITC